MDKDSSASERNYGQPQLVSSQSMLDAIAKAFPPGTQDTNRMEPVWTSYSDMDPSARCIADGLIATLANANDTSLECNDDARKNLWDNLVFRGGWDTNCTVQEPGKIRPRSSVEVSTLAGTIKPGMPQSTEAIKKQKDTPAHRMAGQPVYLKPSISWDDYSLAFLWSDSKGRAINSHWVQLTPGYSPVRMRAEAMVKWDDAEHERVTLHNNRWVGYWARCRVINWMKDRVPSYSTQEEMRRPTREVPRREDHSHLYKLRTCRMVLGNIAVLAMERRLRQVGRPDGTFLL